MLSPFHLFQKYGPLRQVPVIEGCDVLPALRAAGILKQTGMEKKTAVHGKCGDRSVHQGEALRSRSKAQLTGRADTCVQQF